jgi:molybdate-binding protein/DNA-binding XRE family transcriptional regulator
MLRQARGWTQAELASAAGLSRTGVGAIEAARLVPSVAAALQLAGALDCTVEDLFGRPAATPAVDFAWQPAMFPCRYWAAEIGGRTLLFPVESGSRGDLAHDGIARHPGDLPRRADRSRETLVLATCDPAVGLLAALYELRTGGRVLYFTRTSGESLDLVQRGLAHAAGVHFAAADDPQGNAGQLAQRKINPPLELLHVAQWEEGLARAAGLQLRSATSAARAKLRWIGRPAGAAARRYQEELLGKRPPPRHTAHDHRAVVAAIRGGWADIGVCLRLVSEEGRLPFLSLGREQYDLCYPRSLATEARIVNLVATIRSPDYRRLLAELPGYQPQPQLGEIEYVEERQ